MNNLHYLGAALGLGMVVIGASIGIGRLAAAAAESIGASGGSKGRVTPDSRRSSAIVPAGIAARSATRA